MDGFLLVDLEGKILEANRSFESMSGYTISELTSMNVSDIEAIESPDLIRRRIKHITQEGSQRFESQHRQKNGAIIYVEVSCLYLESQRLLVCFIRDITFSRMQMMASRRLEKLESLSLLSAGISHDFQNLFTPIMSNASLLYHELPAGENKKVAGDIVTATKRASDLTKKLTIYSAAPSMEVATISVEQAIKECVSFVLGNACPHHIEYDFSPDLNAIKINRAEFQEVIDNITINAVHAMTQPGVIRISATNICGPIAHHPGLAEREYVCIDIADSGPGIPHQVMEKIFDPYFTTKVRGEGTGLGLAICHEIIRKYQGSLTVSSTIGQGATFHILLPATIEAREDEPDFSASEKVNPKRFLIMDDQPALLTSLTRILRHLGHEVVASTHGQEAVEFFTESVKSGKPFDCVIFDLTVPGKMGGQEALWKIKNLLPRCRSIACTGYLETSVQGFDAVLCKPYTIDQLSEVLHWVFRS